MTREELAQEIAKGLINTGVEGGFNAVSCSTAGDYPSIGCSQWEGNRADELLANIFGGDKFIGRSYSDIESSGETWELENILDSPSGQQAQLNQLSQDCLVYVERLQEIIGFNDSRCLIYAGIWCPTSHAVVGKFIERRRDRGFNITSLQTLRDLFFDEYTDAAGVGEMYRAGYQNRAERTFQYVAGIDLTSAYGVPAYGKTEFGY